MQLVSLEDAAMADSQRAKGLGKSEIDLETQVQALQLYCIGNRELSLMGPHAPSFCRGRIRHEMDQQKGKNKGKVCRRLLSKLIQNLAFRQRSKPANRIKCLNLPGSLGHTAHLIFRSEQSIYSANSASYRFPQQVFLETGTP
jgi:hypothetical protein